VVYLDADTIALTNLSRLYRADLQGKAVGGVLDFPLLFEVDHGLHGTEEYLRDIVGVPRPTEYVNAGVLVMDLRRMRAMRFVEQSHALLEQKGADMKFRDQDALNSILAGNVTLLDPRWNSMITMAHQPAFVNPDLQQAVGLQQREPFIVHFAGPQKPWHAGYDGPHLELWSGYRVE
jgi:lipopolysaccharide biosynthesis glycosyltransferase